MQVQLILDPLRDPKSCVATKSVPGETTRTPCLAPAKWLAILRRGVTEARYTACDAHVFPIAQYALHRFLLTETAAGLIGIAPVGEMQ